MTSGRRVPSLEDFRGQIVKNFEPRSRGRIGAEREWLVYDRSNPDAVLRLDDLTRTFGATGALLRGGSKVSYEPGGQVEISTVAAGSLEGATVLVEEDSREAGRLAGFAGLALESFGIDPARSNPRVVNLDRYEAMEAYFDVTWPSGRRMMRDTAALQVNVDFGDQPAVTWRTLNGAAPVLAACFANSPYLDGKTTGWLSNRLSIWSDIDPSRTRPVPASEDPAAEWAAYVMSARVMFIRTRAGREPVLDGPTFRDWVLEGHELGLPAPADLDEHLTTLFPPVRPRGWCEVRVFDALGDSHTRVAIAVTAALAFDQRCADEVAPLLAGSDGLWEAAARGGLDDPRIAEAAIGLFGFARPALGRLGAGPQTVRAFESFAEQYVAARRTPAHDLLEHPPRQLGFEAERRMEALGS